MKEILEKLSSPDLPSRRLVLGSLASCAGVALLGRQADAEQKSSGPSQVSSFIEIIRAPDYVGVLPEDLNQVNLIRSGITWKSNDIALRCEVRLDELNLLVTAISPLSRIHLRWKAVLPSNLRVLGDAWERSYGDLGWHELIPERAMPWYFLTYDGKSTHGYGVKTGANALAFWQCDREGISLWLDVRNGGNGVLLSGRTLQAATIVTRKGNAAEDPFASARAFCRIMSPRPRMQSYPVYGSNDWYYAYGESSATQILRDAALMAEVAPSTGNRPFTVIDGGWEDNPQFPDMARLASDIQHHGVRPGIWIRPMAAAQKTDDKLLLPDKRFGLRLERPSQNRAYDPTIPEAREKALAKVRQAVGWQYDLIKHDFSTFDLLGQWGFEMGPSPTIPNWNFYDRSKTNAEIIREFYDDIRKTAGEKTLLIGCNVIGHLSAGIFDLQRTGDDVSGKVWERTRRMGVNTLAFRLPQHNTLFAMDADCIPITNKISWSLTKNWLYAVANTGTTLLVSPAPEVTGPEQKNALREAFGLVSASTSVPEDWLESHTPSIWRVNHSSKSTDTRYEWLGSGGALPFEI
jgi:alpha-galactosidase